MTPANHSAIRIYILNFLKRKQFYFSHWPVNQNHDTTLLLILYFNWSQEHPCSVGFAAVEYTDGTSVEG